VKTSPAKIRLVEEGANPWYEVVLIEGRNRQIRRMFEHVGHHVEKIKRVQLGPLVLDAEPGRFRELTKKEVEELKKAASGQETNRLR
jgi:23S rRNA pseudouridine2605 synthase